MRWFATGIGAGLLAWQAFCTPVVAAELTVVKVALTDMSSVAGVGPAGRGMMGPGMMGRGPFGPGMMGPGMMGPGMMGHGMMGIRIDQATIKAGPVRFDVTNWSQSIVHEMAVIAVDNPLAPLPYDYTQALVPEDQVKSLGDTEYLQPNESRTLDVTLKPGSYLLICNVPGHYAAGMFTALTVTP